MHTLLQAELAGVLAREKAQVPHASPKTTVAARWDGVMPTHVSYGLGETMPPEELRAAVRYTAEHRNSTEPLDVALEGRTDGSAAGRGARHVMPYAEAGLTWWIEALGWWRGTTRAAMTRLGGRPEDARFCH